jgi:hypothetical protein
MAAARLRGTFRDAKFGIHGGVWTNFKDALGGSRLSTIPALSGRLTTDFAEYAYLD